jgi:cyclase
MGAPTVHHARHREQLPPPQTVEVADGVWAYIQLDGSWWLNNTGFVPGPAGVLAVDASSTERRTRAFLDAIAGVTREPVRALLNTHHHGDHTNGNCLFGPVTIIGHRSCRAMVAEQQIGGLDAVFGPVEWGDLVPAPPNLVFDERLDLWVGNRPVELHYVGMPAHTVGDVVAWLPLEQVLFAGDLVFDGGTPFVLMGSVAGSLAALERLRRFGAKTIVPGHGPVCGPSRLDTVEGYLRFVQRVAAEAKAAGLSPLDAARETDLGEFAALHDSERLVGNLHRAYQELDGGAPGTEIDVAAAFADMIAYNGGRPLRCLA